MWTLTTATTSGNFSEQRILVQIVFLHKQCQYSLGSQYTPLNLIKNHDWFSVFFYTSECGCLVYGLGDDCFFHHMQHPIVEVGILHVLQSGLSPESTPLSANGGILGKDARVLAVFLSIRTPWRQDTYKSAPRCPDIKKNR